MHIHINYETEIDIDNVCKMFLQKHPRRMETQVYCFCNFFSIYLNKNLTFQIIHSVKASPESRTLPFAVA